jgi:hypothetical protein
MRYKRDFSPNISPVHFGADIGMKTIRVGASTEKVIERADMPPAKLKKVLGQETVAVIGYGVQGRGQSLNMRDNGVKVIIGLRKGGDSWKLAIKDGWKPGKTLLEIPEAVRKGTVVQYLLSDAGQKAQWPLIRDNLQEGSALYFSHGFSIVYRNQTGVVPPKNVDVILVAPKGSGTTVRRHFLEGRGIKTTRDGLGKGPLPWALLLDRDIFSRRHLKMRFTAILRESVASSWAPFMGCGSRSTRF